MEKDCRARRSGELLTYSRSGQVRVLASTGARRSSAEPEVPTITESGVPGYVVDSWQGVFAPAKTPPEIVQKISGDLAKALVEPALVEKLARNAYTVESSSPEELAKFLKTRYRELGGCHQDNGDQNRLVVCFEPIADIPSFDQIRRRAPGQRAL
jgi:tripartite-type tricarboxylate transporter receptor subunit TctC